MPPPVCSRVAIRIGFGRLPPACARGGKDHGDTDAHCARYQETRPAGAVACADSAASSRGSRRPARLAGSRSPDRASDARAALVMPAAPPSALGASEHAPARAHPDLEHGFGTQRRIRDPHILCNHAFDVRQSGEQAFAQALFAIHFFGRKTEYAGTPLTLTKSTARRRTDIHENSNSASLYSLQGRYLFSDALPPMVICLTVMVVVTRFEFRMPLFIGLSLFTFDLYQWHIVLLRVLAP